ncbi:uncharacterized protein LOC120940306 isoform X5 [Rana temporaria]|uniref:uncharacterized protein LOC120940306 isoform X5 n=1 Tax=Rana temporaria TaxID=8407 RepID=UPI001AAD7F68|nr:uncharacterized protein LOC120940306 isoform X5 [Rana temporaria]
MLPHANILIVGVLIVVLKSPGGGSTVSHPVLTMSPDYRMYVRGEAVTLMCNASGDYKTKHFYFYKDSKYLQTDNTHMHRIHSLAYDNIGIYACEFWEVSYQSTRSNKITIYLTEIPSAPSIFLTPSLPYNREDSFKMTCSLPNDFAFSSTSITSTTKPLHATKDFAFSSTSITSTTKPLHTTKAGIDTVSTELMTSAVHVGKTQLITTYYPSQPTNITIKENIQENASSWLSVMFIFFTSFILINILILVYLFIKRKTKQTAMSHVSEHIVNITELQHAQALPEAPFIPGNREDLEESHLYSEIDPTTTVLPQSSLISLYATEKKIYLIPPIYKTDLSHHCG